MIEKQQYELSLDPDHSYLYELIPSLVQGATIETSTKKLDEIDAYPSFIPAGSDVFVAWLPGSSYLHVVDSAKRLRKAGMNPVPHLVARQLASRNELADYLARLRSEADVTRVLAVAGDTDAQAGPYDSSLSLLESDLPLKFGIRSAGIAGYPEGHHKIPEGAIVEALDKKIAYGSRTGLDLTIVTQFCFEGSAILDWLNRMRLRGITLPVRIGVAGPATIRTLLAYGARCGIGNSIRALGSHALSLTKLLAQHGPEKVVRKLVLERNGLGIAGLHFFPFGGFEKSAKWINHVANGRFRLTEADESFVIQP